MRSFGRSEVVRGVVADSSLVTPYFLVLGMLCLVPTAIFFFFKPSGTVSSLAPGTILVCLVLVGLMAFGKVGAISATRLANYVSLAGAISVGIFAHLVGSIAVGSGTEPGRALLSLPLLLLMLGGGLALARFMAKDGAALERAISLMRWLLIGLTLLAMLGVRPWQGSWEKPIFPFTEPSHLALVLNPFLMHACVTHRGVSRYLWLVGSVALAFAAQSLTMLASMTLTAALCLPLLGILAASTIAIVASALVDLSYFKARLDFDAGTQNLSSLVYRQGWELVGDALQRTSGWGVGFQQLGYAPFRSPSADVLYTILRDDANTHDGGFLLAKIVSEFGVFGCLIVLAYLVVAASAALSLRRMTNRYAVKVPEHVVFALCVTCSFAIDMFVRDVGYFGSSVLLFVSSLYILWEDRSRREAAGRFAHAA